MKGKCFICGTYGDLSFEHVPPKAAFNDTPIYYREGIDAIKNNTRDNPRGRISQKGMGRYSLCPKCNNNTGKWYASHFVKWCYQGMDILVRTNGNPRLVYLNYVILLRIIKQIVTMFFTANGESFAENNPYLVEFILNKEKRYLPPQYSIFCYYNWEGGSRTTGICALGSLDGKPPVVMSELCFPPYGYVMCINSNPPDKRLFDISSFANYGYNEFKVMTLDLKVLPTFLAIPGDYRTKKEIEIDRIKKMMYKEKGTI